MKNHKKISVIFLFISISFYAQSRQDSLIDITQIAKQSIPKIYPESIHSTNSSAELILMQDIKLKDFLNKIELDGKCLNKHEVWYLEYFDNNITLSKTYVQNLIQRTNQEKNLYITIINNQLFFLLKQELDSNLKPTSFQIELSEYEKLDYVFGMESVFWYFAEINNEYKIIYSKTIGCD